jgi:sigma-E factor negative regulatory protein RseC
VTQTAVVEKLARNGDAFVRVYQSSACAHACAECSGVCGAKRSITVQAKNPLRARPGSQVTVETATAGVVKAAALVYLLPLAFLLAACILGSVLGASETAQALAGLGGLLAGCAAAAAINRFIRRDRPLEYTIVQIDEEEEAAI